MPWSAVAPSFEELLYGLMPWLSNPSSSDHFNNDQSSISFSSIVRQPTSSGLQVVTTGLDAPPAINYMTKPVLGSPVPPTPLSARTLGMLQQIHPGLQVIPGELNRDNLPGVLQEHLSSSMFAELQGSSPIRRSFDSDDVPRPGLLSSMTSAVPFTSFDGPLGLTVQDGVLTIPKGMAMRVYKNALRRRIFIRISGNVKECEFLTVHRFRPSPSFVYRDRPDFWDVYPASFQLPSTEQLSVIIHSKSKFSFD